MRHRPPRHVPWHRRPWPTDPNQQLERLPADLRSEIMATKTTAKTTTAKTAEVVPAETQLVQREGTEILGFINRLVPFLTKARDLENRALETLKLAKTWAQPKTADEDAALKDAVRVAKSDAKDVEDHWEITTVFSRFHKRLTSRRAVATDALKQAVQIGTNLHEAFVRAEERRVQEEADRKRREEEARAQKQRDDELAELERQALAAEEASGELSAREQKFVDEYHRNGGRGVDAARLAGYKNEFQQASRLLTLTKILDAIKAKQQAEAIRQQQDALRATPLETREVEVENQADTKGDRANHKAVVVDAQAFIAAVVAGSYGIPLDTLTFDQSVLNEYAKKIGPLIERWPGIRYKKTTTIV